MLIYLDMCCLKRPFDDQSQPRVRLETEAVLQVLALEPSRATFVRSAALFLENDANRLPDRAAKVDGWLRSGPAWKPTDPAAIEARVDGLRQLGLKRADALHLALAEQAGADRFATTDDRLIAAAGRRSTPVVTAAYSILECLKELIP